jgi:predicted 3-demethylubiquinone-9 3-methyltransferase (glyoxalase superfamily)
MQKITPFLWFDTQAEEAAHFYVSLFPNSRIRRIVRHGAAGPGPAGAAMTVAFELNGLELTALNGGPQFPFTEAFSLAVTCDTQDEIDALWDKLRDGGRESRCGWLKDRYGLSWQVVPAVLPKLLGDEDPAKAGRTMRAMLGMVKLDMAALLRAHAGGG